MARGGHHTTCGAIGRTAGWSRGAGERVREEGVGRVIYGAQRSNQGLGSPPWRQACNSVRRVCDSAGRGYGWFRCELASAQLHCLRSSCAIPVCHHVVPILSSCCPLSYRGRALVCFAPLYLESYGHALAKTRGGLGTHACLSPRSSPDSEVLCVGPCAPSSRRIGGRDAPLVPFVFRSSSRSNVFSVVGCFYWT